MAADLSVIYRIAADITGLEAGVNRAAKATEDLQGTVSAAGQKIMTSLAAAFSVGAITGAIAKYAELTSHLADLEAKTGIGAEALQRLNYAAEQNGNTLDQVTTAIGKLGKGLAGGDDSAKGALDALGLSFKDIRTSAPDVAFAKIGDAISKIEDPMARSKIAMDLFGKSGAELLPTLTGNLSATAAEADRLGLVMSEETVQAGDKFDDTMKTLELSGTALMGQVLQPFIPLLTELAAWLGTHVSGAMSAARGAFDELLKVGLKLQVWFFQFIVSTQEAANSIPFLGRALGVTNDTLAGVHRQLQESKDALAQFTSSTEKGTKAVDAHQKTMATLNLEYAKNAEEAKKAAKEQEELAQAQIDLQEESDRVFQGLLMLVNGHMYPALTKLQPAIQGLTVATGEWGAVLIPTLQTANGMLLDADTKAHMLGTTFEQHLAPSIVDVSGKTFEATEQTKKFGLSWDEVTNTIAGNLTAALTGISSWADAVKAIFKQLITELIGMWVKDFLKHLIKANKDSEEETTFSFSKMFHGLGGVLGGMKNLMSGWVGWATLAVAGVAAALSALTGLFRGGHIGTVINPHRDAWFDGRSVQDIGDQLGAVGHGGEEARALIQSVFDAKTDDQLASSTGAIDALLHGGGNGGGGNSLMPGDYNPDIPPIEWMAAGGIITQPRIVGVGEAGPEAIVPMNGVGGPGGLFDTSAMTARMDALVERLDYYTRQQPRALGVAFRDAMQQPGI